MNIGSNMIFGEGTDTGNATKKREKRKKHKPVAISLENCYETTHKTSICLAIY